MDDWRLCGQERYLFRKKLTKMRFAPSMEIDHTHCAFCWEKFGVSDVMSRTGYKTTEGNWWICNSCFHDFKDNLEWTVE